jgi:hypothetical protein
MSALEKKITDALVNETVTSANLAALISELEVGIAEANENAELERAKALDPLVSPDAKAAHEASQAAKFDCERLQALLPRVKQRHQQVANQECYDRWASGFDDLLPRFNTAATNLKSVYEECQSKLLAALTEAVAVDAEVDRLARSKPYNLPQANGDRRNLPAVELAARGLVGVAPGCSLVKDVKLPAFAEPNRLAWPPPQPSLAAEVATQIAAIIPHPGANWWKVNEERNRAAAEESREHAARQAAEREQRFKEQQKHERAVDEQRRIELRRATGWPV